MCISKKILDMLYLMFISVHTVLKEKVGHLAYQIHPYCNEWKIIYLQCSINYKLHRRQKLHDAFIEIIVYFLISYL